MQPRMGWAVATCIALMGRTYHLDPRHPPLCGDLPLKRQV